MVTTFSKSYSKILVAYCLKTGKCFLRFYSEAKKNGIDSSKKDSMNFQNSFPFERSACFYMTLSGRF